MTKASHERLTHFRSFLERCFKQILSMLDEVIEEMKNETTISGR